MRGMGVDVDMEMGTRVGCDGKMPLYGEATRA